MPPANKMKWDSEAHEKLLLAVLEEQNVKVDFEKVGTALGISGSAVQQHLNKLRRQASTKNGEGDSGSNEANGAGGKEGGEDETAKKKRKTATPRKPRATPAKGKGKAAKAKETEVADPVTPMKREREETMEESDHEDDLA